MRIVEETKELNQPYAPHLRVLECSLAPGKEWSPPSSGWCLLQISEGVGYWLQGQSRAELGPGTVLVAAHEAPGSLLASCLNGMSFRFFTVVLERLSGLLTQGEQDFFKQAARRKDHACQVLPPHHPVAAKMKDFRSRPNEGGLLSRLILLQILTEALGPEVERLSSDETQTEAKDRLRMFLRETPPETLLEISFGELARMTHCTPRHLSRVFYDLAGMSFRDKRTEIRLARARELLATSQSKLVDVAFGSGYKSLSLFNQMFTRRFGLSPGPVASEEIGGLNGNLGWLQHALKIKLRA